MLLLNALPPKWDYIAAIYLHGKTNHTTINYATVRNAIVAEYDRTNSTAGPSQHAHKISAMKRKGEHPSFSQQRGANQHKAEGSRWTNKKKKAKKSGSKGKGRANFVERSPSPNPFTLAASAVSAPCPMISLQPLRAATNTSTIALFKPMGTTYSKVAAAGPWNFTRGPKAPGPNTLQLERTLLRWLGVTPSTKPLKMAFAIRIDKFVESPEVLEARRHFQTFTSESPAVRAAVAASNQATNSNLESGPSRVCFNDIILPPVAYMPKTSTKKKAKKLKKVMIMMGLPPINTKTPMPPPMAVNVSDEELDWGSDRDVAESAYQASAIQIDQWENPTGDHGIFDDHYDPRQVIFSQSDAIHANQYPQYDSHVAYNVCKHVISVDTSKINRNSLANCVKCKEDKLVQFIADTGASNTFTFDKSDFTTFTKDEGNIQTADKKAVLQVQGYGTVFIKHEITINGKMKTVTSKLQLVYYAPDISY